MVVILPNTTALRRGFLNLLKRPMDRLRADQLRPDLLCDLAFNAKRQRAAVERKENPEQAGSPGQGMRRPAESLFEARVGDKDRDQNGSGPSRGFKTAEPRHVSALHLLL